MINDKLLFIRDGFCLTISKAEETGSAEEHPASNKIMCCVPLLPLLRSSGEGGHANQRLRPQWSSPWTSPPWLLSVRTYGAPLLAAKAQQRFNVTGDFWGGFDQKEKSWAPTWKKARSQTGFQTAVAWSGKS